MRTPHRRFFFVLLFALGAILSVNPLHAELIANAEFRDGGDGTIDGDDSGSGWADSWIVQNAEIGGTVVPVDWVVDIPDYGSVSATTAIQFTGSPLSAGVSRELEDVQSGDDIYISFLTKWETGVVNGNDFVVWWFENQGGPNIGFKANEGSGDDGLDFVGRTAGNTNAYSTDLEVGDVNMVVGRLSKSTSGDAELYDIYELWVNPSFDDEDEPQAISEGASSLSEFSMVGLRSHQINPNGDEPDDLRFANLRIGTDWASVFPPLDGDLPDPGDFNNDGDVNFTDFLVLSSNMYGHLDGVSGFENGDINRDGQIDLGDFHKFVEVFNAAAGSAASAQSVPEPSGLFLAFPLILLLGARRQRRA